MVNSPYWGIAKSVQISAKSFALITSIICATLSLKPLINFSFFIFESEGRIDVQLDKMFWGELFGQVTDKYGVRWMIAYRDTIESF